MFTRTCLVCQEKDKRIEDLLSQIQMLREMAMPTLPKSSPTAADLEMDRLVSGSDFMVTDEASPLLTGSYDNNQQVEIE